MKQTTLFIFCLLAMAFGAESAASQVTRADYERADTILKCSDRVYSPAIHPEWIDSSHYFWYKNHEKEGDFYYLVNAESGKKQRAADKKGLAAFFSKKQKKLAESLLKEEEKRPDRWRRREEAPVPVVSPDKKWEAYVKDNNLYLSPLWDEKEKDNIMKNVLIIGSTGQIGSELTMKLRSIYNGNIVAGYIPGAEPKGELAESGPSAIVDITNEQQIAETVSKYHIDTIYNLAALLSAVAEAKPQLAWKIGMGGLFNVLEVARTMKCAVFTPSSIGVFGNNTPKDKTPQDTIRNPRTMYGVTKVSGELLSDYYNIRFGVDTRSVRFPGLISYVTPPGGGTTDYAVDIYYSAAKGEKFVCPIGKGTYMDMMYMPDALRAAIEIMEADPSKFVHRNSFNIASMSFDPEIIFNKIKEYEPNFEMEYQVDPLRQAIAESWPNSLDDTCAREEWGWKPEYDLDTMTKDMLAKLKERFKK